MPVPMRGVRRAPMVGDHRCTPDPIWVACRHAAGIKMWDLDVASNPHSRIPARISWYGSGPDDDGLRGMDWFGDVWENPPFSKLGRWSARTIEMLPCVDSITFLGPGDSSTNWWRRMTRKMDAWAAWPYRIHFPLPGQTKGSAPGPIHLFYTGPRSNRWRAVMEHVGCVTFAGG